MITHIVAMAAGRVIGADGGMPWHIPEDFKFFKATTMGHAMIMGRKTFDSIGRPLPGRLTIVVTRRPEDGTVAGGVYVPSVAAALAHAASVRAVWGDEVFVIGGGELFRDTLGMVGRVHITLVEQVVAGDTYYPALPGAAPVGLAGELAAQIFAEPSGAAPQFGCTRHVPRPEHQPPLQFLTFERPGAGLGV